MKCNYFEIIFHKVHVIFQGYMYMKIDHGYVTTSMQRQWMSYNSGLVGFAIVITYLNILPQTDTYSCMNMYEGFLIISNA